jgi:hypothetical protein
MNRLNTNIHRATPAMRSRSLVAGPRCQPEVNMVFNRQNLFLVMALASTVSPACGQAVAPTSEVATIGVASASAIPNFSGVWHHWLRPGFGPPASGPGPVTNRSRVGGVSNYNQLAGDYTNPILNHQAAEVVKEHSDLSSSGVGYPTPSNQCWPDGVPYVFWQYGMQMLQEPDKVTILYLQDHEFRQVRLNQPHPADVIPSWYGDSVGHYEGNTLVIDTVGIKWVRSPWSICTVRRTASLCTWWNVTNC